MKHGQIIVITGATSGLGEMLAMRLATSQNKLILTGRNEKKLDLLKNKLREQCEEIKTFACDFTNSKKVKAFADHYCSKATVIINSAASFGETRNFLETPEDEVLELFQTNVVAPMVITQSAIKNMFKNKYGRIINIGSTAGIEGYSLRMSYCTSKHAMIGFTKTLNREFKSGIYGKGNIKSFCVVAGPVQGVRLDKQIHDRSRYKGEAFTVTKGRFKNILGEILQPETVMESILNLLEPDYVGEELVVFK
jgi:short-subunit dehydrogenase